MTVVAQVPVVALAPPFSWAATLVALLVILPPTILIVRLGSMPAAPVALIAVALPFMTGLVWGMAGSLGVSVGGAILILFLGYWLLVY